MPQPVNEQDLVRRCISGDAPAWWEFHDAYSPLLLALARNVLRALGASPEEAEDVRAGVLEALVASDFRVLRSFRWQCSLETWLRLLVRTSAVRALRRKTVKPEDLPLQKPAEAPLDRLLNEEARGVVREEVNSLPERDRRLLAMFFIDGRSYREISEALGLPMGTVATLLSRTRARLRERLEGRGLGGDA